MNTQFANFKKNKKFQLINTDQAFERVVSTWGTNSMLGIDTETSGFYTYYSKICLIQVSTSESNYLIDVLSLKNTHVLQDVFTNKRIKKILHAASGDLMMLKQEYGLTMFNVFDTFLASRYLRRESHSLRSLLQDYLNIKISKKEQKSDWRQRPLTVSQCEYAYLDTCYLHQLYSIMTKELSKEEFLINALSDDLLNLEKIEGKGKEKNFKYPRELTRMDGEESLKYKKIFYLVDQFAQEKDRARFRLLSDSEIFSVAKNWPNIKKLRRNSRLYDELIQYLIDCFDQVVLPTNKRKEIKGIQSILSKRQKEILVKMKKWREQMGKRANLHADLVINNRSLAKIVEEMPKNFEELKQLEVLGPFRLEKYGEILLKILK